MQFTNEQLDLIEKLGAALFSVKDTAIVLQLPEVELRKEIANTSSSAHARYYKGKLLTELELRESIIALAKRGSNPAQKMLLDILQNTNATNI